MNPNSAFSMLPIVVGTDYTPTAQTTVHLDPNTGAPGPSVDNGLNSPVYAILCTVSNTGSTSMQLLGDAAVTVFPAGTFKQGVVYHMYLKKITVDGGGSFVGFRYASYPQVL
jgi:hypothetical protein